VYIIMLTSRSNKSDIVGGIEAGADDFISKPFDKEELRVRVLAGERVVRLERTLSAQNEELRVASARMRRDLEAAARVQRAMLPREHIVTPRVRSAWTYVPTDELAGDAIGLHLIDERYLVSYVVDVSGHGVPAALLAVTAMHALSPAGEGSLLMRRAPDVEGVGPVQVPSRVVSELNRRFCAGNNDGRFLTMILCVLDTHEGRLHMARAGHPLPVVVRGSSVLEVSEAGGLPLGLMDPGDYEDVVIQLEPGDRVCLYSDGFIEQPGRTGGGLFGDARFRTLMVSGGGTAPDRRVAEAVDSLGAWAGVRSFVDDVSLVVVEWLGA
jgi:sigma-B regulation protein RsbU (phosphoserine phosphatase)